jgi:hypothetical protein
VKPEHWGVPVTPDTVVQKMWAENYLRQHKQSVELIRISAGRGMSRTRMTQIWGQTLVNLVLP